MSQDESVVEPPPAPGSDPETIPMPVVRLPSAPVRQKPARPVRDPLAVAFGNAVLLATVGVLRWEAARIDDEVAAERADGDCARARNALAERSAGNRVADAPLAADGDDTLRVCELLDSAARDLDAALAGDVLSMGAAYVDINAVLGDHPGHDEMAWTVVDDFLGDLPTENACHTVEITDWLDETDGLRGRGDDVVAGVAPQALIDCGDQLMATNLEEEARQRYQKLLDRYPDHELAAAAAGGVTKATQAIELDAVGRLLSPSGPKTQPPYCGGTAPYSAAPPYPQPGPNLTLLYGNDEYLSKVDTAVTVLCAGEAQQGVPSRPARTGRSAGPRAGT